MQNNNVVLFHANCTDGSGAALAAFKKLADNATYIPVTHGIEPDFDLLRGKIVYILDFSYKRDNMVKIGNIVKKLIVLDHHETAENELAGLAHSIKCDSHIEFDMNRSGATMSWDYFHDSAERPALFQYIEDRDLWLKRYPETDAILTALINYGWKTWLALDIWQLKRQGDVILQYNEVLIDNVLKSKPIKSPLTTDHVPIYNLPEHIVSDALAKALAKYPESPYAIAYVDFPSLNMRKYSLRSRNGSKFAVNSIAKYYGGGGHRHAAGFEVPLNSFVKPIQK